MELKSVKIVRVEDLPTLLEWREKVIREVFKIEPNINLEPLMEANREYYKEMIPKGNHVACTALYEGEIIGCGGVCFYQELPSPENPTGRCAYIMNVYVLPKFRKQGIGKKIVEWLLQVAKVHNASKIYLETAGDSHDFYEKIGFREMPDMMKFSKE